MGPIIFTSSAFLMSRCFSFHESEVQQHFALGKEAQALSSRIYELASDFFSSCASSFTSGIDLSEWFFGASKDHEEKRGRGKEGLIEVLHELLFYYDSSRFSIFDDKGFFVPSTMIVQRLVEVFWPQREKIAKRLTDNGFALAGLPVALQEDEELARIAVRQNGLSLQYASPNIQACKELVLEAITRKSLSYRYASSKLKKDHELMLAEVVKRGSALRYIAGILEEERKEHLSSLSRLGCNIDRLCKEIYSLCLFNISGSCKKEDPPHLRLSTYFPSILGRRYFSREPSVLHRFGDLIVLKGAANLFDSLIAARLCDYLTSLYFDDLRNEKMEAQQLIEKLARGYWVVFVVLWQDGLALEYVSGAMRSQDEFVSLAVTQNGLALQYVVPKPLDECFVMVNRSMKHYPENLRQDPEVFLTALKQNPESYAYIPSSFKNSPRFQKILCEHGVKDRDFLEGTF